MYVDLKRDIQRIDRIVDQSTAVFLALDLDPVLSPIGDAMKEIETRCRIVKLLQELTDSHPVCVAVISDRGVPDLSARIHIPNVTLMGNAGLEICSPAWHFVHPDAARRQSDLFQVLERLQRTLCRFHGAWLDQQRYAAMVDCRNLMAHKREELAQGIHAAVGAQADSIVVHACGPVFHIRPRVDWSRGDALRLVRCRSGMEGAAAICIGACRDDCSFFLSEPDSLCVSLASSTANDSELLSDYNAGQALLAALRDAFARKPESHIPTEVRLARAVSVV